MMRQFNCQFGKTALLDNISREIHSLKEQINELNSKYVEHNQVRRLLEVEIIEMETEEEHLNRKFEILKELYAQPETKPTLLKPIVANGYFMSDKYSVASQTKRTGQKMESMPDTLDMETGAYEARAEKAQKHTQSKITQKSWKMNTTHEPIYHRKVDLEDMQNVYDEITKMKGELDEAVNTNSSLNIQLESHFKGHYGIKSCSACKKRYTPLNTDPVFKLNCRALASTILEN